MSAFFDDFDFTPDGNRPPGSVRLSAKLRTHAGEEPVVLAFRLDDDNGILFDNAQNNPGRRKLIRFPGRVSSNGTQVNVIAPLFYGHDDGRRSAFIRAAVFRPGEGTPMHHAAVEIFIR